MMTLNRFIAVGAGSTIVLAASAQVLVPPCCKYLWEWPPQANPPLGGCSGSSSYVCQTGSDLVWGDDPLSDAKGDYIEAQCFQVILHDDARFYRVDCAELPPPGAFIGVLPNGQCCYAVGDAHDIEIIAKPATFMIRECDGVCSGSQS